MWSKQAADHSEHDLHISHPGQVRAKQAARVKYYWPGITNDVESTVKSCEQCNKLLPSHSDEPLLPTFATYAFEQLSADLFAVGGGELLSNL